MKRTSFYSKSFKSLAIALPIVEFLLVIALIPVKFTIIKNQNMINNYRGKIYYVAALIFLIVMIRIAYRDYMHLIAIKQTTPRLWKKLYVIIVPASAIIMAILITIFL